MELKPSHSNCIFCSLPKKRIINESKNFFVVRDMFPISKGHTLIISKDHIEYFKDLPDQCILELFQLIKKTQEKLLEDLDCNDFNIGVNDGESAGQTIKHFHLHLIPRYLGDTVDPRGGIRWIIPEKADYWS